MGRINLTPLRVRKRAIANVVSGRNNVLPGWVNIMGDVPPAQIFTRQQPLQHKPTQIRTRTLPSGQTQQYTLNSTHRKQKSSKPSRIFTPIQIRYEEDTLRSQFFADHPWELARPRLVVETSGNQHQHADWSTGIEQPGIPVSGESVVQRQLHLLETTPDITVPQAYDVARKEFYTLRRQQATSRRIAAEEAEATGARFGPSIVNWGVKVENKMYDDWERSARQTIVEMDARMASFTGQNLAPERQVVGGEDAGGEVAGGSGREAAPVARRDGRISPRIGSQLAGPGNGPEAGAGARGSSGGVFANEARRQSLVNHRR